MTEFPGLPVTVRSTHVDMFGHVSHLTYLAFMEWARFAWAEHVGMPIPQLIAEQRMGPAVLKADIRYQRECRLGDQLLVTVAPTSARRVLGTLHHDVIRPATDEIVCQADMSFVMMDLDTRRPCRLPEAFRYQVGSGSSGDS
ncbi:MAG: acyl-CoA thioesterase [Oligoflexia bacterium]|nr:acyl-CoA thioesterase [Oligoflexia bacterium]